jgi:hypothetical protein
MVRFTDFKSYNVISFISFFEIIVSINDFFIHKQLTYFEIGLSPRFFCEQNKKSFQQIS